ncbi:MAG: hypothetical protein KY475_12770, partial [Planctomycetes bacterium]|nr:hypothetical protein [Planctomycetota bacterium]
PVAAQADAAGRRLLVGLLIGVSAIVEAALYSTPRVPMSLHGMAVFGLALGQISLVIGWAVLGRRNWLLRLMVTVGVITGFAALLPNHFGVPFSSFLGFLLLHGLDVAAWSFAARIVGLRFRASGEPTTIQNEGRPWRYSLAGLFAVTTAAAAVAALVRAADLPDGSYLILLGYHAAFVLVSLVALAPMLVVRLRWNIVLMLLALIAAPILGWLAGSLESNADRIAWLTLCQAIYLLAAGWVLRAAGYRAAWSDCR